MRTSWSRGHATHNQDWDLIPESRNRYDKSVSQWKPAPSVSQSPRFLANRWSVLVDLRLRILLVVVSTAVDGWRGRIDDLKRRWPATIAAFFRPDEAVKTTEVLLYSMWGTFLWWCGGLRRPEMGDRRRERELPVRGERCSKICYGADTCMVYRCRWRMLTVGSWMKRSDGCDWLDLQVYRTTQIVWVLILCGAVHRNLGASDDVAQRD